jgi:hypothetical protein
MSNIELHYRPGLSMGHAQLHAFHQELREVAATCLGQDLPDYQCLNGSRREFTRLVIAVARDSQGRMEGFCSSYLLEGGDLGQILHLGLTCVRPGTRGKGLTHKLTSKVVMGHLLRTPFWRQVWISNVACVLSSLGNVGLHFVDVYPSPFVTEPSRDHQRVARLIAENYRWELLVPEASAFDEENFVFAGSVKGTSFEKEGSDRRFHHRHDWLNDYYRGLMDFERGDEVLQIGKISLMAYPRHLLRSWQRRTHAQAVPLPA